MLVLTDVLLAHLGKVGVYGLAAVTGVTDVDPFIMSLTQSVGLRTPASVAAIGVLIAAASNNVVKGIYAWVFSERETARQSLLLLLLLALLGLTPVVYLALP